MSVPKPLTGDKVVASDSIDSTVRATKDKSPPPKPPKTGLKHESGDPYVQSGMVCDDQPESNACFLEDGQRARYLQQFRAAFNFAYGNYKAALNSSNVKLMLEQGPEPHWLGEIVIDFAGGQIIGALVRGLSRIRTNSIAALDRRPAPGSYGPPKESAFQRALGSFDDERLKSILDASVDAVKKGVVMEAMKVQVAGNFEQMKASRLSFINHLISQADVSFGRLQLDIPGTATDAELVWLYESFRDPTKHAQSVYEAELAAKLKRFARSGITDLGRQDATDHSKRDPIEKTKDTRLVEVHYSSRHPPELYYQSVVGTLIGAYKHEKEAGFSELALKNELPKLGKPVPTEFAGLALAQHMRVWGTSPGIEVINESAYSPHVYGADRWLKAAQRKSGNNVGKPAKSPTPPAIPGDGPSLSKPTTGFANQPVRPILPSMDPLGLRKGGT